MRSQRRGWGRAGAGRARRSGRLAAALLAVRGVAICGIAVFGLAGTAAASEGGVCQRLYLEHLQAARDAAARGDQEAALGALRRAEEAMDLCVEAPRRDAEDPQQPRLLSRRGPRGLGA